MSELGLLLYRALYSNKKGYINIISVVKYNWKAFSVVVFLLGLSFYLSSLSHNHYQSLLMMVIIVLVYSMIAIMLMERKQREWIMNTIKSFFGCIKNSDCETH